jgi:hypothetical protein
LAGVAVTSVVVLCNRVDDARQHQSEIGLALLPFVKLDNLPALPTACVVEGGLDVVGHIGPESAEDVRTQRGAAAIHAQHEDDRSTLYGAGNCRKPIPPRRFDIE